MIYSVLSIWILPFLMGANPAKPDFSTKTFTDARGCSITIRMENRSNYDVLVSIDDSKVKIKNGFWSKIFPSWSDNYYVRAKNSSAETTNLDLGCNYDRQYKFQFWQTKNSVTNNVYHYYPSQTTFTRSTNINLGNVGRFFP